jgi:peptidoglycan/LPS O-acetylase OafA/YrhL
MNTHRVQYLDSVRGLAALAVTGYHYLGWRWSEGLGFKLGAFLFNGSDAVSLFFVLSGLVLSWKYFHPDGELVIDAAHYRSFLINRVVRLYLPFLAALAVYYLYNHRHDPLRQLVFDFVTNRTNWFQEAVLIRGKHDLYSPAWTLEVEMVASALIPFLVLLLRHSRALFLWLMGGVLLIGYSFVFWGLIHFGLGMLLTYHYHDLQHYSARNSRWHRFRYPLLLVALALLSFRSILRFFPLGEKTNYWMAFAQIEVFEITGLGAALVLAFIIHTPWLQRLLEARPLRFLGKISYSVYLLHWLVVIVVMNHWDVYERLWGSPQRAHWLMLPTVIAATLVIASGFNFLVEQPAIALGKRLSARFKGSAVAQPTA